MAINLSLLLPILFASPDDILLPSKPLEAGVEITSGLCTDEESGEFGVCIFVEANRTQLTIFVFDGSLQSIKIRNSFGRAIIWQR